MGTDNGATDGAANRKPSGAAAEKKWGSEIRAAWARLDILGKVLIFFGIGVAGFFTYSVMKPHQWIFNVQAQSRIVELVTPAENETKWRINNAILCVRGKLELPVAKFKPLVSENTICGGRRWSGFYMSDPEQTLVLTGAVNAVFELRSDSLFLALRVPRARGESPARKRVPAGDDGTTGLPSSVALSFTDGSPDIHLNQGGQLHVNIVFPAGGEKETAERIFPFIADTTIGRDVNWTGTSLLTNGHIDVYTADISPDKRKLVDEAELLLGDQLRLYPMTRDAMAVYPKGFVRVDPKSDAMDIIAFGAADRVRIERFGDNGYDFKPGLLLLLLNDQALILVLSIFVAGIGLLTSVAGVFSKKDDS